jgi:hypothetical protein
MPGQDVAPADQPGLSHTAELVQSGGGRRKKATRRRTSTRRRGGEYKKHMGEHVGGEHKKHMGEHVGGAHHRRHKSRRNKSGNKKSYRRR